MISCIVLEKDQNHVAESIYNSDEMLRLVSKLGYAPGR